jgi:hypothetical protein
MTAWASHKEARVCVAKQAAKGTAATTGFIEIPNTDELNLDLETDYEFFQMGGGFRGKTHSAIKGDKITGKLTMPAVPGYVGTGDLYDWMWARGDGTAYFQGYYATIYKVINLGLANEWVELYKDVMVGSTVVSVDYGTKYATIEANLIGLALPTTDGTWPASPDDALLTTAPYKFSEATITAGGGASVVTRNHKLECDNMNEMVESLSGSTVAYDAPNKEFGDWKVSFDQWYIASTIRAAFLAGTEGAYTLTLTRAGGYVCTFTIPRLVYTKAPLDPGTGDLVKQSGISFQALVDMGETPATQEACIVAEVAGS